MVADGILSWLTFAGIPHAAIDTDWQHHTLSDRYKMHLLDATSSEDEFEQLLENLPESPTLIVDFPGNKTSKILEFAAHFQMLKSFRASSIRPTLLIFTADDSTAKDSALETLEFFGDAADYLLVENSARFKSDSFKATPLYDEFTARNSPTLVVPRISAGTLNAWEAAQHRLGEYLSLDKISKADGLNWPWPVTRTTQTGSSPRTWPTFKEVRSTQGQPGVRDPQVPGTTEQRARRHPQPPSHAARFACRR